MNKIRVAFFGTPEFATIVLQRLAEAHIHPSVIVTAPDAPQGRGLKLTPSPVRTWALENDIPTLTPTTLKIDKGDDLDRDTLYNSEWDLFIVASYGKILPQELLDLPKHGTLNVHPSLLPAYRGASPVRSAILEDRPDTVGVTIMLLDAGMDSGPIVAQARIEPEPWPPDAETLEHLLAREGGSLLAEVLPLWIRGEITPEAQDHATATFSKKIEKSMGHIDFSEDPWKNFLKIRGLSGWPGTFFFVQHGEKEMRVKITDATFQNGILTILSVIPEGKKEMLYADFLRSHQN